MYSSGFVGQPCPQSLHGSMAFSSHGNSMELLGGSSHLVVSNRGQLVQDVFILLGWTSFRFISMSPRLQVLISFQALEQDVSSRTHQGGLISTQCLGDAKGIAMESHDLSHQGLHQGPTYDHYWCYWIDIYIYIYIIMGYYGITIQGLHYCCCCWIDISFMTVACVWCSRNIGNWMIWTVWPQQNRGS